MTLDTVSRLDVRWLLREGYVDGRSRVVSWPDPPRPVASLCVTALPSGGGLACQWRLGTGVWEAVRQVVALDWTPCHYGGQRLWFRCGGCQRRVAVLYLDGTWFLCRHCYGLPYRSQQETANARHYRKVRKIRDRVGASLNLTEPLGPWDKPKGMHWRTWERLRQQEAQVQEQIWRDMEALLGQREPVTRA